MYTLLKSGMMMPLVIVVTANNGQIASTWTSLQPSTKKTLRKIIKAGCKQIAPLLLTHACEVWELAIVYLNV